MSATHEVVVGVGSNSPDAADAVRRAVEWLCRELTDAAASGVYATAPIGGHGPDYANAVVRGRTALSPELLNARLKEYERAHGREHGSEHGSVAIDLDLVCCDAVTLRPFDFAQPYFMQGYREVTGERAGE